MPLHTVSVPLVCAHRNDALTKLAPKRKEPKGAFEIMNLY
jgi:hypothetical protein